MILPGAIGARIFREDVVGITSEMRVSAGGEDMGDVFVMPEVEQGVGIAMDQIRRLAEEFGCGEAIGATAIRQVGGEFGPGY